jgi:protoheme IX farnesyltransferase
MKVKYFSLSILFLTFLLILLGGVVHNTESSLACPDWPLCYGQFFPKMEGGILIEHSHRLLASLIGFLCICLVFIARRETGKDSLLTKLSWAALCVVIFQGLLGGITVIYLLPTIVSTTHLATAMVFISLVFLIFHEASFWKKDFSHLKNDLSIHLQPLTKHIILLVAVGVYLQIILGAFMRHSGAGAACGLGLENSLLCLESFAEKRVWWPSHGESQLHMLHRLLAVVLSLVVTSLSIYLYKSSKNFPIIFRKKIRLFSLLAVLFILTQSILGVLSVTTYIGLIPTTAHLGGAVLLLITLWNLYLNFSTFEQISFSAKQTSLISDLFDLAKPRLASLVILTAFIGLYLAPGEINFFKGLLAIVLTTLIVAGSCVLNCYIERDLDKLMQRTKNRPLPTKRISPKSALCLGLTLLGISLPLTYFYVNPLTFYLGLAASVLYLFVYTPLKRISSLSLYLGAIPGAIPPLMGWTAKTNQIDLMSVGLFTILFIWQLPHFLSISIFHQEDYKIADIKTMINSWGLKATKLFIFLFTICLLIASLAPGLENLVSKQYLYTAFILGLIFVIYSGLGFFISSDDLVKNRDWARQYFHQSLIYLPAVLASLIFLR